MHTRTKLLLVLTAVALHRSAAGQAAISSPTKNSAEDAPLELSVFEVTSESDSGYVASNVISGTRFSTRLQDLPKPVDVVTSEFMRDIGALELTDALRYTSGVVSNGASGVAPEDSTGSNISLRGYNTFTTYRDGYRAFGVADSLFIDRIEVIKGPSSVFSGTIEPGGTVNIITPRAPSQQTTTVRAMAGSFSRSRFELVQGGPLTPAKSVRYRFAAAWEDYESYVDFAGRKRSVLGGTVDWDVSRDTRVSIDTQWVDTHAVPTNIAAALVNPDRVTLVRDYNHGFNRGGPDSFFDLKQGQVVVDLKHKFNESWALKAGTYWRYQDQYSLGIGGSTIIAVNAATGARTVDRVPNLTSALSFDLVPQINLLGNLHYAGVKHQIIVGYDHFYTHQTNLQRTTPTTVTLARIDIDQPASYSLGGGPDIYTRSTADTRLVSVQRGYTLSNIVQLFDNDRLLLLQGFRYGTAHYNVANRLNRTVADSDSPIARTWNFGVSYRLAAPLTAFASYSQSYLPQRTFDFFGAVHKPVTGAGYDYGLKYDFLGHRFTGSLVGYQIERANTLQPDPDHAGFNIQSGEDNSRGLEYSLLGRLTSAWQVVLAYGYNSSRITSDPTRPQNVGLRTANIPRNQGSIWNRYAFRQGTLQGLGVGVGVNYIASRRGNPNLADVPGLQSPAYTLVNARVSYDHKIFGHAASAALAVNNVFDRTYLPSYVIYGDPINYMGTVSVQF
jgi:iron complex outermembrane receptor protein